jgi:hypothetical protein
MGLVIRVRCRRRQRRSCVGSTTVVLVLYGTVRGLCNLVIRDHDDLVLGLVASFIAAITYSVESTVQRTELFRMDKGAGVFLLAAFGFRWLVEFSTWFETISPHCENRTSDLYAWSLHYSRSYIEWKLLQYCLKEE